MTLIVRSPAGRTAERRYILDLILSEWLGLEYRLEHGGDRFVTMTLAGDLPTREISIPDVLLATSDEDWLTEKSMPAAPLPRVHMPALDGSPSVRDLPVLFGRSFEAGGAWRPTSNGMELGPDLFGSAFFEVTRYEEIVRRSRDRHGRFPVSASVAAAERYLDRPIVDDYVDLLWASIHSVWPSLRRRPSVFRLRPTHDVDEPWAAIGQPAGKVLHALAGDLVGRRDPELALRRARSFVEARRGHTDRDPNDTFDELMDASERNGVVSTFYFLAGNEPGEPDFRYRIDDPRVTSLLRRIHERGHEVGLHASYGSFLSPERTAFEFDALRRACLAAGFEQPAWGVRQHYLRFQNPQTWRNHELAGIAHDSTLGFAETAGFRAGTCREFPIFDLQAGRALVVRERPLLVMDAALLGYQRLGPDEAADVARSVVSTCRRHRGDAVLLYHNSSLASMRMRHHYRNLMDTLGRGEAQDHE